MALRPNILTDAAFDVAFEATILLQIADINLWGFERQASLYIDTGSGWSLTFLIAKMAILLNIFFDDFYYNSYYFMHRSRLTIVFSASFVILMYRLYNILEFVFYMV
jgi:hypothetical protein